jgi:hypothetical protein
MDDSNKITSFDGYFRNGITARKCYFYSNAGVLERREINRFKKMKTTIYYPNGNVKLKGNARVENTKTEIHYFFYGKWKSYDEFGKLEKVLFYQKGKLVNTKYVDVNIKTNDSLIDKLNFIDSEFASHNTIMTDSIKTHKNNVVKRVFFERQLHFMDSISFSEISRILDIYNYPSRDIVGESVSIPFYILSFAPLNIKEKYLNQFIFAADKGDISWKSLAFFIDKLKIAKGEKQVYGTQGVYDEKYNFKMYPAIDPETLNLRRKKVGLEEY